MLLHQAIVEARNPTLVLMHDERLLTPAGRQTLVDYLKGAGPIVAHVDREADIRQLLAFREKHQLPRLVITGGAEAWRVAPELARAGVPVIVDPLLNLPENFDAVGATLENAARLHAAGVAVGFSLADPEPHNVRKLRQAAGNAAAHGLPRDAALAAITRVPAQAFGVGDRAGSLEVGRPADFVLWDGDPLEVTSWPRGVWIGGVRQPDRSRQTELLERYLEKLRRGEAR
jgi:imidazolonepropionase-like amidohydrolase